MISRETVCIGAGVVLVMLVGRSPVLAQSSCPFAVTGSLTPGDLNSSSVLFDLEPPNACGANQPCNQGVCMAPLDAVIPCSLDVYTLATPPGPNPACVTVTVTTPCGGFESTHSSAWLGTFTPPFVCNANFLGDIGASPAPGIPKSYSFNVPPATTFSVVINLMLAGESCPSYTIDVTGCDVVPVELLDFGIDAR